MQIFSIKENDTCTRKTIKFLGIKITISKDLYSMHIKTQNNYKKVISRISSNVDKKIKVVFLVNETTKWGSQQLYDKLENHPKFEPLVLVTLLTDVHNNKDSFRNNIDELYTFFKNKNMNVEYAYKNGKYLDLKQFKPDIVFYQQPWQIAPNQFAEYVSEFALCCYTSYSIASSKKASQNAKHFFYTLWKYFLAHDCMKDEYLSWMEYNQESLCVTGHPKLDFYKTLKTDHQNKRENPTIIYAPHHSIGNSTLKFATFDWSGKFMLEYAKSHPEINWIFKPHPNLKSYFILKNYMTEQELDSYYNEWSKIGEVCLDGDYFDKFVNSDLMVTDCSSFLVEYFFTGKPLIHLVSKNSEKHSNLNQLVAENYYIVKNQDTLESYLDEIMVNKNDFLKTVRDKNLHKIFSNTNSASENILSTLEELLKIKAMGKNNE